MFYLTDDSKFDILDDVNEDIQVTHGTTMYIHLMRCTFSTNPLSLNILCANKSVY